MKDVLFINWFIDSYINAIMLHNERYRLRKVIKLQSISELNVLRESLILGVLGFVTLKCSESMYFEPESIYIIFVTYIGTIYILLK